MTTDEVQETGRPLGFSGAVYEAAKVPSMRISVISLSFLCNIKWNELSMLFFLFLLKGKVKRRAKKRREEKRNP